MVITKMQLFFFCISSSLRDIKNKQLEQEHSFILLFYIKKWSHSDFLVNEIDLDSLALVPSNSQPSYDRPWYLTSIVFMSWWKRSPCSSLKFNFLYSFTVGIFATNISKSIKII
jgi:hypothetical protein